MVGVGLGNIFEGGQIKLRPAVGGSSKKPVGAERVIYKFVFILNKQKPINGALEVMKQ